MSGADIVAQDPVEERDIQKLLAMLDDPRVKQKILNIPVPITTSSQTKTEA